MPVYDNDKYNKLLESVRKSNRVKLETLNTLSGPVDVYVVKGYLVYKLEAMPMIGQVVERYFNSYEEFCKSVSYVRYNIQEVGKYVFADYKGEGEKLSINPAFCDTVISYKNGWWNLFALSNVDLDLHSHNNTWLCSIDGFRKDKSGNPVIRLHPFRRVNEELMRLAVLGNKEIDIPKFSRSYNAFPKEHFYSKVFWYGVDLSWASNYNWDEFFVELESSVDINDLAESLHEKLYKYKRIDG